MRTGCSDAAMQRWSDAENNFKVDRNWPTLAIQNALPQIQTAVSGVSCWSVGGASVSINSLILHIAHASIESLNRAGMRFDEIWNNLPTGIFSSTICCRRAIAPLLQTFRARDFC
jgi:hypothetical protein